MLEYIQKNSIFYILPENINNAGAYSFEKSENNTITFISQKNTELTSDDTVEIFVNSTEGIIYFKSAIKNVENNLVTIDFPNDYEILQRRENKRIKLNLPVVIEKDEIKKEVMLIDISVGGIKILSDEQMLLNTKYSVIFNFDQTISVFGFVPKRIMLSDDEKSFYISGQIMSKSPKDKIALVQYCYKKEFEQSNRE